MLIASISSDSLRKLFIKEGVPEEKIHLRGAMFNCLSPKDITVNLSKAMSQELDILGAPILNDISFGSGDFPVCNHYSFLGVSIALRIAWYQSTHNNDSELKYPPAFGQFEYIPDADWVPESMKGFPHSLCWAVHIKDGLYYLSIIEPQRSKFRDCMQPRETTKEERQTCLGIYSV